MSRIGKKPIPVPKGVNVTVHADAVEVKGPKGTLKQRVPPGVKFEVKGAELVAETERPDPELEQVPRPGAQPDGQRRRGRDQRLQEGARHRRRRLSRRSEGQAGRLRARLSHPVVFDIPAGIDVVIDKQTHVTVTGIDRQLVGQVAANIRRLRKPDPYKQKGVRYTGEVLKKKVGKTGSVGGHEDSNQEGSARADSAAAAQADSRHGGAAAAGRVPIGRAHLRAGHRRHGGPHGGGGVEHRAGAEDGVQRQGARRQPGGRRGDRQGRSPSG